MRNWYYFTWLSGDFNVEQHVHFLDVCSWVMKDEYPVKAVGLGGRQVRTGPEYGHIYDHFSRHLRIRRRHQAVQQLPADAQLHRRHELPRAGHQGHAPASASARRGMLHQERSRRLGATTGEENNLYQTEHDELFAAIRNGKPINNGEYMAKSTLLAIMGRMAAYTGQAITWDMALNSKEDLTPPAYDWNVKLPEPPVAMPGVTKFE